MFIIYIYKLKNYKFFILKLRKISKKKKFYSFVFLSCNHCFSKKTKNSRMGKGKGNPEQWVAVVKQDAIMFEVKGVPVDVAKEALRLGGHKLPVTWKIVAKEVQE